MNAPNVVTFFATFWAVIAVAFGLCHYGSTLIGAPPIYPMEYPFDAAIYLLWVPLVPVVVRLARRYAPVRGRRMRIVIIHAAAAVVVIFVKLFAHRLVFCYDYNGPWARCVCEIRLQLWLVNWYIHEVFVYAATAAGTWAFDAMKHAELRELTLAQKEHELAAAELQTAHNRVAPHEILTVFASIAQTLRTDPPKAETMISEVADSLRVTVQAIRRGGGER